MGTAQVQVLDFSSKSITEYVFGLLIPGSLVVVSATTMNVGRVGVGMNYKHSFDSLF